LAVSGKRLVPSLSGGRQEKKKAGEKHVAKGVPNRKVTGGKEACNHQGGKKILARRSKLRREHWGEKRLKGVDSPAKKKPHSLRRKPNQRKVFMTSNGGRTEKGTNVASPISRSRQKGEGSRIVKEKSRQKGRNGFQGEKKNRGDKKKGVFRRE